MATITNEMSFAVTVGGSIVEAETYEPAVAPRVVSLSQPNHPATEQYRVLRYRLECLAKGGIKALAFTSAQSGDGKTTTAVNAAIALGKGGRNRVVLVDADLRRPGVADDAGAARQQGLCDVVAGRASIDDCLWRFGADELYVLPAGNVARRSVATRCTTRASATDGGAQAALRLRARRYAAGAAAGRRADAVARSRRRDDGGARQPHAEGAGQCRHRRALRRHGARHACSMRSTPASLSMLRIAPYGARRRRFRPRGNCDVGSDVRRVAQARLLRRRAAAAVRRVRGDGAGGGAWPRRERGLAPRSASRRRAPRRRCRPGCTWPICTTSRSRTRDSPQATRLLKAIGAVDDRVRPRHADDAGPVAGASDRGGRARRRVHASRWRCARRCRKSARMTALRARVFLIGQGSQAATGAAARDCAATGTPRSSAGRRSTRPGWRRGRARAARTSIVVAVDDRRGLNVRELLACRLAGLEVIDGPTFAERALKKIPVDLVQAGRPGLLRRVRAAGVAAVRAAAGVAAWRRWCCSRWRRRCWRWWRCSSSSTPRARCSTRRSASASAGAASDAEVPHHAHRRGGGRREVGAEERPARDARSASGCAASASTSCRRS